MAFEGVVVGAGRPSAPSQTGVPSKNPRAMTRRSNPVPLSSLVSYASGLPTAPKPGWRSDLARSVLLVCYDLPTRPRPRKVGRLLCDNHQIPHREIRIM